ncbi:hypothetical protein O181_028300 [Austropuccinia psidii MF-1]|uniref:Uncharacterized protein n=1 Tax=Austropuccinia psidii MF-1 TaxID=1389203 RepID=A0A9Q3CT14_9BASI|nr:hypothetical protein [Austropuccinia psidii MF-1]
MLEPQRTDGSRTEGEVSVSSVSLELISGVMGEKGVKRVRYTYQILNYVKVLGPCFQLWPPQGPQYGAPIRKDGAPFQSLEGPGLISEAPGHMGQFGTLGTP